MTAPTQAQINAAKAAYNEAYKKGLHDTHCMRAALTAAAEAGEQRQEGMAWIAHEAKLRTIERCAQVAQRYLDAGHAENIPTVIRAIKD